MGAMGEGLSKSGHARRSMLCVEFYTPCVLQPKNKVEGYGSNAEQRRPEIKPAGSRRAWDEMKSSISSPDLSAKRPNAQG